MQNDHRHQPIVSIAAMMSEPLEDLRATPAATPETVTSATVGLAVSVLAGHLVVLQEHGVIDSHGFDALGRGLDAAHQALAGSSGVPARRVLDALVSRVDAQSPPELAGAVSLGLAREEWLATMVRLAWRDELDAVLAAALDLRAVLTDLADSHVVTIMPAFAGNRASQPTNLGHLLGGVIVPLRSATGRLERARVAIDRSPLGAGSLAGEFLALDRERQATVLGFASPVGNTLDAVMSVEDLVEAAEAIAASVAPVRRLLRELGAWMRSDPDSFLLADAWQVQAEATNPLLSVPEPIDLLMQRMAAVEDRCRTFVARLREVPYGPIGSQADAVLGAAHDVGAMASSALADAQSLLVEGMTINRAYLGNRAGRAYTTGGDFAAFLMSEEGLPPSAARAIAAMVLRQLQEQRLEVSGIQQDMIDSAAMLTIGREIKVEMETLGRYLAPRRYLERRAVIGSPASASTREWLASERGDLEADRVSVGAARDRAAAAIGALGEVLAAAAEAVD
ncbi:MAG: lyase family protein [Thermomicrobiales bacterium]